MTATENVERITREPKPVLIVQGGQWGSEAKGLVAAKLGRERKVAYCVRTGTVNAGHTVWHRDREYKMQQLPVGWVHGAALVIGPGAFIHPDILEREIAWIRKAGCNSPIFIDYRCGIQHDGHAERSAAANRHHSMGATGKGCSEAVMEKIGRRGDVTFQATFVEWVTDNFPDREGTMWDRVSIADTVQLLNQAYDRGDQILIEGTQGTMLDLHLGPYPYTTHKQTQAANWLAECGLSSTVRQELWLVLRTYPIRVAGNSGPLPGELDWVTLAQTINTKLQAATLPFRVPPEVLTKFRNKTVEMMMIYGAPPTDPAFWSDADRLIHQEAASEAHAVALEHMTVAERIHLRRLFEMTTVTRKLRRVAQMDGEQTQYSLMLNRPHKVAITFVNYLYPELWDYTGPGPDGTQHWIYDRAVRGVNDWITRFESRYGAEVGMVGLGPLETSTFFTGGMFGGRG